MPMIYRRNRGLSPTRQTQQEGGVVGKAESVDASLLGRTRRWWHGRSVVLATHRVYQTMWLAALVYAFLGLPVLGRVLNFVRYVHRFSVPKMVQGLLAGLLQDLAIFLQASTLICLVKLLLDAGSVAPPAAHTALAANGGPNGRVHGGFARSFPNSGFLRERSGSGRFLPVYMPVLANEYDALEAARAGVGGTTHRTLLSLGSGGGSNGSAMNQPALARLGARAKRAAHTVLILALLQLILVTATVASVADFCLQVTMHPRLNRAFVEIFFNYMGQFTASLMDEEVLTRTVLGSWAVYLALMAALTYGFFTGRLPLAPDFLHLPRACCCCLDRRFAARKDSMASSSTSSTLPTTSTSASSSYMSSLFTSYWRRADKGSRPRRSSSGSSGSSGAYATAFASSSLSSSLCSSSSTSSASAFAKPGPLTVLARCVLASVFVTCGALSASLLVDGKHGVDMKLMANAMFALQTEPFFERPNAVQREEINCTEASMALRSTLGATELYELENLGNDDHCALLWRKTTGFQGDSFFELDFSRTNTSRTTLEGALTTANGTTASKTETETEPLPPNIIVINMESWRHLDVGVLGGAQKKTTTGKSATPEFDALAKTGILYRKHYTQCVQTTRTLLTMLFGMLPSCTETTALKAYGTSLNVRGLPQFLKERGYFNMFWSAVDLTWEYWDKFLVQNGFDKLVDDRKIRKMLHETRDYQNTPDDHFSWGMHDHLSFEMLLYAIEAAHNASDAALVSSSSASGVLEASSDASLQQNLLDKLANATTADLGTDATVPAAAAKGRHYHAAQSTGADQAVKSPTSKNATLSTGKPPLPGWEGLQAPYFIDMYTITSHNPWALPDFYQTPDLSGLYTRFNKKYLDSMYFSDEMLGDFIRALRSRGLMRNTVVVIQGDHGYGRLEHDNNPSIADSGVWDEAGRVPFLLLADDFLRDEDRGTEVDQLSMQSDLMATIADLLGVSPERPLLQHGYGHSMMRRRPQPEAQVEAQAAQAAELQLAGHAPTDGEAETDGETEALAAEARQDPHERRVMLCNPFNGMSKGVRTEELKYIFHPDGSFNVFEPQRDPAEKHPLRTGFDVEAMDATTRAVYEDISRAVDLNQFLYEANRFMTPLPVPEATLVSRRHQNALNETLTEQVEPQPQQGLPPP